MFLLSLPSKRRSTSSLEDTERVLAFKRFNEDRFSSFLLPSSGHMLYNIKLCVIIFIKLCSHEWGLILLMHKAHVALTIVIIS